MSITRSNPVQVSSYTKNTAYLPSRLPETKSNWGQVSKSANHTLAIKRDGTLWAWGYNTSGQLGISNKISMSSPVQVGTSSWNMVVAGASHSIGITADGKLYGWGLNNNNILATLKGKVGPNEWAQIAVGSSQVLAVKNDGTLWVWGTNSIYGELGLGDTIGRSEPTQLGTENDWSTAKGKIAAGFNASGAIKADGRLFMWGAGGRVGNNSIALVLSPVQIPGSWTTVSIGGNAQGGIKSDGTLWMWGNINTNGRLGTNDTISRSSPTQIAGGGVWTQFVYGADHGIAVKSGGAVFTWGQNTNSALGTNDTINRSSPVQVGGFANASYVYANSFGGLVLRTDGTVWTWGANAGLLGTNSTITRSSPIQISSAGTNSYTQIGYFDTTEAWGIQTDGTLWTWGNPAAAGGRGDTIGRSSPFQVGTSSWTTVFSQNYGSGGAQVYGLINGVLYAWGSNIPLYQDLVGSYSSPTLLDVTTLTINSPIQLGTSSWSMVTSGDSHSIGIKADGTLWTWGINNSGLTGSGKIWTTVSSPVQLAAGNSFVSVSAGKDYSMAIDTTGQLYGIGENTYNQIGSPYFTTPSPASSWSFINAGGTSMLALKPDKTLWVWGTNTGSTLGTNTTSSRSSPIQLPAGFGSSTGSWNAIAAYGGGAALGIDTTNRWLYAWGSTPAMLTGVTTAVRSPILLSSAQTFGDKVFVGVSTAAALDASNRLWLWGVNALQQVLGLATNPVSVPTMLLTGWSWTQISFASNGATIYGITTNGLLYGWGQNTSGELAQGNTKIGTASFPQLIPAQTGKSWINVVGAMTTATAMAIQSDYTLWAWGYNPGFFTNTPAADYRSSPVQIPGSWTNVGFASTGNAFIAHNTDGLLYTMGTRAVVTGEIANAASAYIYSESYAQVSAGAFHTVALTASGMLKIWGSNTGYSFGNGNNISASSPVQISPTSSGVAIGSFTYVSGGSDKTFAIDSSSRLWAWGGQSGGKNLGLGSYLGDATVPMLVTGNLSWSQVSSGASHTIGLTTAGEMYGWGYNQYGELGLNYISNVTNVNASTSWTKVSVGKGQTFYLRSDGVLYGAGAARLGDGSLTNRSSPVVVGSNTDRWSDISVGFSHVLGLKTDSTLWAWGNGLNGEFGTSSRITSVSPIAVGTSSWTQIAAAVFASFGIKADGTLWAWGSNDLNSSLGFSDTVWYRSSPVQIGTFTDWTSVTASNYTSPAYTVAAKRSDGSMYLWGSNLYGQIGDASVNLTDTWKNVAIGSQTYATTGVKNATFAWGNAASYELGDGTIVNKSSPIAVASDVAPRAVLVSPGFTLLHNRDSTVSVIGSYSSNGDGRTGSMSWRQIATGAAYQVGIRVLNGIPQQIWLSQMFTAVTQYGLPGNLITSGNFDSVHGTSATFAIIDSTGALYMLGDNSAGQFGDMTITSSLSAVVQINTVRNTWKKVVPGVNHTIGIDTGGRLWGWGNNTYGQLGLYYYSQGVPGYSVLNSSFPVQIGTPHDSYIDVAAGISNSYAIKSNGTLWAWGLNMYGALGTNDTALRSSPVQVPGSWSSIHTNSHSVAGIKSDGTLWLWGYNSTYGHLGTGDTIHRSSPVQVSGGGSWTQVHIAYDALLAPSTIAQKIDGTAWVWGKNTGGQLGDGTLVAKSSPIQFNAGTIFATPVGGSFGTLTASISNMTAIGNNGVVRQAGTSISTSTVAVVTTSSPVMVGVTSSVQIASTSTPILSGSWKAISTGTRANTLGFTSQAAIKSDGTLWTWGNNTYGQLGSGTTFNRDYVTQNGTDVDWSFVNITAGDHAVAIKNNGTLWAWGYNAYGELGTGDTISRSSPVQVGSATNWISAIAATGSGGATLALKSDGTLWAVGNNQLGQLGQGDTVNRSAFVQVPGTWSQFTTSLFSILGLATDGTIWSWGYNATGELGQLDVVHRSTKTQIGTNTTWAALAAPQSATANFAATDTSGNIWAWGSNATGQLGQGDSINRSSPVQIAAGKRTLVVSPLQIAGTWNDVSTGGHSVAIKSDGSLWTWGYNANGMLGQSDIVSRSSPTQLGIDTWSSVRAAGATATTGYTNAIKSDGTLWAWGYSDATTYAVPASSSSPVFTSWYSIAGGPGHGAGIRVFDRSLWVWGLNDNGQLGLGDTVDRSSPVQITSVVGASWNFIAGGQGKQLYAITTLGKLYTTGNNVSGYLALGDTVNRSTFTQVPGSWIQAGAGIGLKYGAGTGGTLWVWGLATNGTLGNNQVATSYSSPIQLGTSSWSQVSAGGSFGTNLGIDWTGRLFSWGSNGFGQLGIGLVTSRSSPVQVGALLTWYKVSQGYNGQVVMATNSSGGLFTWGYGGSGQLGNNSAASQSSPVQVAGTWNVTAFGATTGANAWAINSVGQLYGWGPNGVGQVGDGTLISRSAPVQIMAGTSFNQVWATSDTNNATFAQQVTTGTLWAWGSAINGRLAIGNTLATGAPIYPDGINRSNPVQLAPVGPVSYANIYAALSSPVQINTGFTYLTLPKSGGENTVAIRTTTGALYGWGYNNVGQLGDGTITAKNSPVQLPAFNLGYNFQDPFKLNNSSWLMVATGVYQGAPSTGNAAAIRADNTLWVWGENVYGQTGTNDTIRRSSPVQVPGTWSHVAISGLQIFAVKTDGTLWGWGQGQSGLGDGTTVNKSSPVQLGLSLVPYPIFTRVATNAQGTGYAETTAGNVYAWGNATAGAVGNAIAANQSVLQLIGNNTSFYNVSASNLGSHAVGLGTDYSFNYGSKPIYSWGNNQYGQLGNNSTVNSSTAVTLYGYRASGPIVKTLVTAKSFTQVNLGGNTLTATAQGTDGLLYGWGDGGNGALANNPIVSTSSPITIGGSQQDYVSEIRAIPGSWNSVAAGTRHSVGIQSDNKLYGMGNYPASFAAGPKWYASVTGGTNTYTLAPNGTLWVWGTNTAGSLGQNATTPTAQSIPYVLSISGSWSQVAALTNAGVGIRTDGSLWGWGFNTTGQLGTNDTFNRSSPVQIGTDSYTQVVAGSSYVAALKTNGSLWIWGGNADGVVGDGSTISRSSPVQVGTSTYTMLYGGVATILAQKTDGSLWGWGRNNVGGTLGINDTLSRSSPVQIAAVNPYKKLMARSGGFTGIKADNTVWTWGENTAGGIGDSSTLNRSSPVQLAGNWRTVFTASTLQFQYGFKDDGTIWSWGYNPQGQLGLGDTVYRSSPVQLSSAYNGFSIGYAGYATTLGLLDPSGDLYLTGSNNGYDPLATVPTLSPTLIRPYTGIVSTPTQLGSKSWVAVSAGEDVTFAVDSTRTLYFWGKNQKHQSATSSYDPYISSPTQVGALAIVDSKTTESSSGAYIKNS